VHLQASIAEYIVVAIRRRLRYNIFKEVLVIYRINEYLGERCLSSCTDFKSVEESVLLNYRYAGSLANLSPGVAGNLSPIMQGYKLMMGVDKVFRVINRK
jgi:hypothetical protein